MSRIRVRTPRPPTEWSQRSPEERARILNAPFPVVRRIPGKTWAGTIVTDETDDPVLRHCTAVAKQEGHTPSHNTEAFDNIIRNMEG